MTAQEYLYKLLAYRHEWVERTVAQRKPALLRVAPRSRIFPWLS